ncbi:MAG TPA: Gfo/Idh/MocA family oxidoreductase [Gemmataceae bacterium]|nr:Gfo/Idh/MocA family oxidoreductase [Gemmataceae bacterium]
MTQPTRRDFLTASAAAGATIALAPFARPRGANDDLRVAVVGFRGQGNLHIRCLRALPGVRVVALCDADRDVLDRGVKAAKDRNETVAGYTDVRKLLESKEVDAITTATPDHWHALVTIWACQAGKDVYVEKPLCHNLWEGRKMVEAARKYDRIVQFGNQNHGVKTAELRLEMEGLGKIRAAVTNLSRLRKTIGKTDGPQPVPESVDYDLWCGPAPKDPLRRKALHYEWHWVWSTGTGELGNNGIYPLDAVRLAIGQSTLPKRVMSLGGRFLFDDDGQTPNTQIALFQYNPGPLVVFELWNLPSEKGPKLVGPGLRCEKGDSKLPTPPGKPGDTGGHTAHQGHIFNFLSVVRSRKVADLRADVLEGHLSTALVHLANASYRVGTGHTVDRGRDAVKDRGPDAVEAFDRFRGHLEANGVDFAKTQVVVGPWLEVDPKREQFVGGDDTVSKANALLRPEYRAPFVVPDKV